MTTATLNASPKNVVRKSAKEKAAEAAAMLAADVASIGKKAFATAESRAALVAELARILGATPDLARFDAIRHATICGIMASALARKGDNRTDVLIIAHCDERLTKYQGFGGLAPVKDGMKGRRTEDEEKAYTSARVQWHGLVKDAGVTVPDGKSGGANNANGASGKAGNSKNAGKTGGATAPKAEPEVAAVSDRPASPTFSNEKQAIAWAKREAAAMLATINKSPKQVPSWLKSAISDFHTSVKNGTASPTPPVPAKA